MLPGVELARRRRLHQRTATTAAATEAVGSACRHVRPDLSSSAMGEAALLARSRLRERLRGPETAVVAEVATYTFSHAPILDPSDAPPSCSGDRRGSRCSRSKTNNGKKKNNGNGKENERGDAGASSLGGGPAGSGRRRDSSASEDVCAVCLDALRSRSQSQRKSLVNLPCSHNYHFDCIRPWLESNQRCPCCRRAVVSL